MRVGGTEKRRSQYSGHRHLNHNVPASPAKDFDVSQPMLKFVNCTFNMPSAVPPVTNLGELHMGMLGTAHAERFAISADGMYVTDHETGLMWARDESPRLDYAGAEKHCAELRLGGYSDWRLPTLDELQTIVDRERVKPAIDTVFFNTKGDWTWTSSEYKGNPGPSGSVWIVNFYDGNVYSNLRDNSAFARAVRAAPAGQ